MSDLIEDKSSSVKDNESKDVEPIIECLKLTDVSEKVSLLRTTNLQRSSLRRSTSFNGHKPMQTVVESPFIYSPLRKSSVPPDLALPKICSEGNFDIENLTEQAFSELFSPFTTYKCRIVKQARDIYVCGYCGNLDKFNTSFLKPAAALLQKLKLNAAKPETESDDWKTPDGWPICYDGHQLIHFGEGQNSSSLRPGDLYLYVQNNTGQSCVELRAKIWPMDSSEFTDLLLEEDCFVHIFSMDLAAKVISRSSDVMEQLCSLVTSVDNGVGRLAWDAVCGFKNNRKIMCQNREHDVTDSMNSHSTEVDDEDDDGYHDEPQVNNEVNSLACLDQDLLHQQQLAILPGCLDVDNRIVAILTYPADSSLFSPTEVSKFFSYFFSNLSKNVSNRGFVIVIDIQAFSGDVSDVHENIFEALQGAISVVDHVIFFTKTESVESLKRVLTDSPYSHVKKEVVSNINELSSFILPSQIPKCLGGTEYKYDHKSWVQFKTKQEELMTLGKVVGAKLVNLIQQIKDGVLPISPVQTNQAIEEHRSLVASVLRDDADLQKYRNCGKDTYKQLQKIADQFPANHDFSDSVDSCTKLMQGIEKVTRKVAKLSNKRLHRLEDCLQLKSFEEESSQVLCWLRKKGEETLVKHSMICQDLPNIKKQEREFEKFYFTAIRNIEKGQDLIEEANMLQQTDGSIADVATSLRSHLTDFSDRLEIRREALEGTSRCYHLLDKSYEWAVNVMKFLSNLKMDKAVDSVEEIEKFLDELQAYLNENPPVLPKVFDDMANIAKKVENHRLTEQIKVAKERCDETNELIKARRTTLLKAKLQLELNNSVQSSDTISNSSIKSYGSPQASLPCTSTPNALSERRCSAPAVSSHTAGPYCTLGSLSHALNRRVSEYEESVLGDKLITEDLTEQGPVTSISKTLLEARSKENKQEIEESDRVVERKLSGGWYGKHHRKLFKRSNTWQNDESTFYALSSLNSSDLHRRSIDSVSSSLLSEDLSGMSSDLNEDKNSTLSPLTEPEICTNSTEASVLPNNIQSSLPDSQPKNKRTLTLIMKEMIQTERDYVSSLEYIIENYIPELLREDIPQALRGQRNVIFGNIEKIYEFHSQFFLQELEQCEPAPFLVGLCFLRYDPQFNLYALYNKNKPKCDILMAEYGNQFFKKKQLELGDKMDLASYLLKPVQRMGKYALLLKQLVKECPESDSEFQDLRAAEDMVRFQLRHGNDLLAMDALKDCDVNVKEQGRLLRQDEFVVWQGKNKKSFRRVFLFEDLILFSKPRRDQENKGYEIYQYKNSIKTTDIGLTEQVGESTVKFEIWFRKRKHASDVYVLQAQTVDMKNAWIQEISKQLWKQALKNREMRLNEMSSMGIGSRPCLDIKPGEDQIQDRSINVNFTKGSWMRRTTPHSNFDTFGGKRPHSIISISSNSSSSSGSNSSQYGGTLNLGFDGGAANHTSRSLYRSVTQHSQCSNESGICADISLLDNMSSDKNRKKAERSDSMMSTDSFMSHASGSVKSSSAEDKEIEQITALADECTS